MCEMKYDCIYFCQGCNNSWVFKCPRDKNNFDEMCQKHPENCVIKKQLTEGLVSDLQSTNTLPHFYEDLPGTLKFIRVCTEEDRKDYYSELRNEKKRKAVESIDKATAVIWCVHGTDQSVCKICNVPKWSIQDIKSMTRDTFLEEMGKIKRLMSREEFLKQQPFQTTFFQDHARKHDFKWEYNDDILMERHREIMPDDVFKNAFENFHKKEMMSLKDIARKMEISLVLLKNRLGSLEIPYGNSHRCTSKYVSDP